MCNVKFQKKLDLAYFFGVFFTLLFVVDKFITSQEIIKMGGTFFLTSLVYFVWGSFCIKELKVKSLKVNKSLDCISLLLYENSLYMQKKVGDYYEFKTRNFIIPNTSIFVKECNKHCIVLATDSDTIWIEKALKNNDK